MQRKYITALLTVILTFVLFGCGTEGPTGTLYTDIKVNYDDKYSIDLSREGVLGDDKTVRIIEAGKYSITGKADDGCIIIEAPPKAEVVLTLDSVSLSSSGDIALYIRRAGTVDLIIKDGTENSLSAATNTAEGAAAILSDIPFTIEGGGALSVYSASGDGIRTKGEFNLSGASLSVNAGGDGIKADGEEASVVINKGSGTVNAANTAIRSAGTAVITGGSFNIESCTTGIEAADIHFEGGKVDITSAEKGIHTFGTLKMNGSKLNLKSEKDGINVVGEGSALVVESGSNIIRAGEGIGISSSDIQLLGGTLSVISKKTGIYTEGKIKQSGAELIVDSDGEGIRAITPESSLIFESGNNNIDAELAAVRADGAVSVLGGKFTALGCAIGLSADTLLMSGGNVKITAREDGILAESKLNISSATLTIKSDWDAIRTGSKDSSMTVESGTLTINARNKALTSAGTVSVTGGSITAESNSIGIIASDISLTGGKIKLVTQDDGVYTDGKLKLDGTDLKIKAQGDGIRADGDNASLVLESGKYAISAMTNALCSTGSLTVLGGDISVDESTVGISSPKIRFADGKFKLYASSLAFESTEDVLIEGGDVLVSVFSKEPEKTCSVTPEGAKIQHTGGQFISFSNDYANFSDKTTVCSVNVGFSDTFTVGEINIALESGKSVFKLKEKHQVQYISVSSPELKTGETYKFTAGEATTRVKLLKQIVRQKVSSESASFKDFKFTASNGVVLNYYLYTPPYANDNMPLVVFLHGSAESGSNLASLTNPPCLPKYLKEGTLTPDCYVLMPQSSVYSWTSERACTAVEELIELSRNTLSKESGIVSLTGFSMGGGGVWTLAFRHPERYNRIAPLSGYFSYTEARAKALVGLPVWDFVGLADYNVSPTATKGMTDALKRLGSEVYVTQFPGAGHSKVPGLTYLGKHTYKDTEISILDWLTLPRE